MMASERSDSERDARGWRAFVRKLFRRGRDGEAAIEEKPPFDLSECANLEESRKEMVRGIIRLSERNAREIMIPRVDVVIVDSEITLKKLAKIIHEAGHSRIPVYENNFDNIVGILYVKDLLKFLHEKPRKFQLKKILHKPYYVPETILLDDLLLEFKKRKLHLAIAVDEYGGFGGIVTLEDVLEEIVGDINDEFDEDTVPEFEKTGKNVFEVDSRMTLSDFNEELSVELPVEEFDTIGGFVFDLFGKIPKKNETVRYGTLFFKVKDIKGTRISRIVVTIGNRRSQE